MTVLVTGAGGQVGREVVETFGARALGLDRAALDVTDAPIVLCDVRERASSKEVLVTLTEHVLARLGD